MIRILKFWSVRVLRVRSYSNANISTLISGSYKYHRRRYVLRQATRILPTPQDWNRRNRSATDDLSQPWWNRNENRYWFWQVDVVVCWPLCHWPGCIYRLKHRFTRRGTACTRLWLSNVDIHHADRKKYRSINRAATVTIVLYFSGFTSDIVF